MCPAVADELLRVSHALDSAASRNDDMDLNRSLLQKISLQDQITSHVKLAQERDAILKRIRDIPEFGQFLKPLVCSALLEGLPRCGSVIVVNVNINGCDAAALQHGKTGCIHIPLQNFSCKIAEDLRKGLKACIHGVGVRSRGDTCDERGIRFKNGKYGALSRILRELWLLVVSPILCALGYRTPPTDLTRIWWCTTGPLAFLPIHAAGLYGADMEKKGTSLCDYAISSYIPTVRALVDRVKKEHTAATDDNKLGLLLICQSDTPGLPPIPGTTAEVRAVKKRLVQCNNLNTHCLENDEATIAQCLRDMNTHSCIHFACHASQNTSNPLESTFYLHDGNLDLSSIIQKRLDKADLAFLSACQTSVGDERLPEEAVHLADGMLAAGFQGVVGTIWSIQDRYGPQFAEDFYANLIDGEAFKSERAAMSLHFAAQKLRSRLGDSETALLAWVPYVHLGL